MRKMIKLETPQIDAVKTQHHSHLSIVDMCKIEPDLDRLIQLAMRIEDDGTAPYFCANETWAMVLKPWLFKLVGWGARRDKLAHSDYYETCCRYIRNALPDCRNCGCM